MNLREYAKGKPCTVRVPLICNGDPEKTVLAHVRMIDVSGAGIKAADVLAAWACSACHDYVDFRSENDVDYAKRRLLLLEGMVRTQAWLIERGFVLVTGQREPRIEKLSKIVPRRLA